MNKNYDMDELACCVEDMIKYTKFSRKDVSYLSQFLEECTGPDREYWITLLIKMFDAGYAVGERR